MSIIPSTRRACTHRRDNHGRDVLGQIRSTIAKDLLRGIEISPETLDRVLYIIGHHHTYSKIDNIDFQILVEADFFVNIDEDGTKKKGRLELAKKFFSTATGKELLEKLYAQ